MKKTLLLLAVLIVGCMASVVVAMASSVDDYINDLKDSNPDVRAKAAYELGCT